MNRKAFTLIELLVVVAIIGILAAVGVVAYNGYTGAAKVNATKTNHSNVVRFIMTEIKKCDLGQELILKRNPTTNTSDLCPYVLSGNASKIKIQLSYHFGSLNWCNTYGLKHSTGTCQEGVATGAYDDATVGRIGELGEIKLLSTGSVIIIDTRVLENEWLVDRIDLSQ